MKTKSIYLMVVVAIIALWFSWRYKGEAMSYRFQYLQALAKADSLTMLNDSLYKKLAMPIMELDSLKKETAWLSNVVDRKSQQVVELTETVMHYKLLYLKGKATLDSVGHNNSINYYFFQKIMGLTTVVGHFNSIGDYDLSITHAPLIIKHAFVKSDSGLTVYTSVNDTTLKVVSQNNFYKFEKPVPPKYRFGYFAGAIIGLHPNIYAGLFARKSKAMAGIGVGNGIFVLQYMKEF